MFPIRVKTVQESDLRMLGSLARNIQRVLPVTQADIDAAAALGQGWVVWKVFEVSEPLDNMRGGTQLIIRQNSVQPGQNVRRVIFVSGPGGQTVVIRGTDYIALPDAIANSLSYVKAFGGTEQNGTPTPDAPMDIVSNNGVLRIQGAATGTVTQTGDPTPTTPVDPVFYQNHGLLLRAIGEDADTYDSTTQTITRAIGYYIFDGTESFGTSNAYGNALYIGSGASMWGASRSKDVLCQYFLGTSSPSSTMPEFTCFFNQTGHFYFRTPETATDFKAWLAELYENGTPLILWFVKNTSTTESFTPSVYADGTQETINVHGKNLINVADRTVPSNSSTNALWSGSFTGVFRLSVDTSKVTSVENPGTRFLRITVNGNTTYINYNSCDSISINGTLTDIYCYGSYGFARVRGKISLQLERGTTTTEYEPYYNGGTATAEMLLKVGDYQDVQSIIDGAITRNVGVKVLDGSENFETATATNCYSLTNTLGTGNFADRTIVCSHFASTPTLPGTGDRQGLAFITNKGPEYTIAFGAITQFSTQTLWKQWLADQYAAGTPVIIVYPLATQTTESVAGQTLQVQAGDNYLEIPQASLTGLELEAQYNAAVSLTIQEVEDANLDNNVTVTIQ